MSLESLDLLKSTGKLPQLSPAGTSLHHMKRRGESSAAEIVDAIEEDPALAELVLQLARGGARDVQDVSTVAELVERRDSEQVRAVALGFAIALCNRAGVCESFDYDRHWSTALARAVATYVLSRELGVERPSQCFIAGLLSELGRVALASVFPREYSGLLGLCPAPSERELRRLEHGLFGINHLEATAALLTDYGFPPVFAAAVQEADSLVSPEHAPDARGGMAGILRAASQLARVLVDERAAPNHYFFELISLRQELHLDRDAFNGLGDRMVEEWGQWGDLLRIPTRTSVSFGELGRLDEEDEAEPDLSAAASTLQQVLVSEHLRVLAVDDDPMTLRLVSRHLERDGYEVFTATGGREALLSALHNDPHVVIADWMMPEMDGLELCKALRRFDAGRRMYFMLLTGREEEDKVVEAFDAGVNDFVSKPFRSKLLLARVRAAKRFVNLQQQVEIDKRLLRHQVAERSELTRKLRAAAFTDVLTELPNRRYAIRRLSEEWAANERDGTPLSVIMIDIDHFKRVNDNYGHDVGDSVLRSTAGVIEMSTRQNESACRLGGEEFLVICPNADLEQAALIGDRIRTAVEKNQIRDGSFSGRVTISVGVAVRDEFTVDVDNLLKLADEAVYQAKAAGRNCVVCWERNRRASEAG
jgi:diguanylate cyclase (GGDEF)-like protein